MGGRGGARFLTVAVCRQQHGSRQGRAGRETIEREWSGVVTGGWVGSRQSLACVARSARSPPRPRRRSMGWLGTCCATA